MPFGDRDTPAFGAKDVTAFGQADLAAFGAADQAAFAPATPSAVVPAVPESLPPSGSGAIPGSPQIPQIPQIPQPITPQLFEDAPARADESQFVRGFRAGSLDMVTMGSGFGQAMSNVLGAKEAERAFSDHWKMFSRQSGKVAEEAAAPDLASIEDVSSFTDWLSFNLGRGTPQITGAVLAYMTGGVLAMGAYALAMGGGEATTEFLGQGIDLNQEVDTPFGQVTGAQLALATGVPIAAIELMGGPERLLRKGVTAEARRGIVRRVIKEAGLSALGEGAEEVAQNAISRSAAQYAQGKPFDKAFWGETIAQGLEEAASIAPAAFVFGGVAGAGARPARAKEEPGVPPGAQPAEEVIGEEFGAADPAAFGPTGAPEAPTAAPPTEPTPLTDVLQAATARAEAEPSTIPRAPAPGELAPGEKSAPDDTVLLEPDTIQTDAALFQFKREGTDAEGVSAQLEGTKQWEPSFAGVAIVWEDSEGTRFVVDGHQRLALAKRLKAAGQDAQIRAEILRETEGITAEEARFRGALKNLAEGGESTTPIDIARVMRAGGKQALDVIAEVIPPRRKALRDAQALSELGEDAFGMVLNGMVPESYGVAVGKTITDPAQQVAALEYMGPQEGLNADQAQLVAEQIRAAGFQTGTQDTLFGPEAFASALIAERAKVLDSTLKHIKSMKRVFRTALTGESILAKAGNVIAKEANIAELSANEKLIVTLERLANRTGPVSDALTTAAEQLKAGEPIATVRQSFLDAITSEQVGPEREAPVEAARPSEEVTPLAEAEFGQADQPLFGEPEAAFPETTEALETELATAAEDRRKLIRRELAGRGRTFDQIQAAEKPAAVEPEAEKKPLYASRPVTNADEIIAWAASQGFKTTLKPGDMHVTVAFSKEAVDWKAVGKTGPTAGSAPGGTRSVEQLGDEGAVVLRFENKQLRKRWAQYKAAGASWDFEGYKPHITITYKPGDVDLAKIEPYRGRILLGAERQEPMSDTAGQDVSEVPVPAAVTEPTEAGEQAVIPGAERISEREEAERRMAERAKPAAAQKPADEGLFDVAGRGQLDLVQQAQAAPKPSAAATYGKKNKIFTEDAAEKARETLRKKLRGDTLTTGIDPEIMTAGLTLAGYHVEAGARSFADFGKAMIADLGESARPYLKMWYNAVRDYPGFNSEGMASYEEVDALDVEGIEDVPSPIEGLEPDRGDAGVADVVREEVVSPGREEAGRGARAGEPEVEEGARRPGGAVGVPDVGATPVGEPSDIGVPAGEPRRGAGPPERGERGRGRTDLFQGPEDDRIATETVGEAAADSTGVEHKRTRQYRARAIKVRPGSAGNIRETLPFLLPDQQEDVFKAETRFEKPDGHGMMFTNGTGTGKTYSGLGVLARAVRQGKENVLVVVPSQIIATDWSHSAQDLDIHLSVLPSTTTAGKGQVVTTYANLADNPTLADRDWDLVIADESHKLMSSQSGEVTTALRAFRAVTNHPDGRYQRARSRLRSEWAPIEEERSRLRKGEQMSDDLTARYTEMHLKTQELAGSYKSEPRTKVVMLSATPFAYVENVDYAEGYLFDYGDADPAGVGRYNQPDARGAFFMRHFGYRMRYGKLTKPDAEVQAEVMERQFHEWLKSQGALSGRALQVDYDYDRKFVLVDDAVGNRIDQALGFLQKNRKFAPLERIVRGKFDYLAKMRLLEAIKAHHAVPIIEQHLALGRQVVVFHDYNEGGGFNPFSFSFDPDRTETLNIKGENITVNLQSLADEFEAKNPYVRSMGFAKMAAPLHTLTAAFPDALVYNGRVTAKRRREAKALFNADNNGRNLIIVQSAAGEAGISLHDTTGTHQRVLINLGMPSRPVTALQEEGRIARIGQASDALFRYMNTGTNWEQWTFSSKIAERAGTAENLALGEDARAIKQAFIDAFLDSGSYPVSANEGKGGKEKDRATISALTPFDKAKSYYFAEQKKAGRRDQREGIDYFATPEPVGFKMVEWANIKSGEQMLEPSAGHGAIARFLPEDTDRTLIEPSDRLASRAGLSSPGAKVLPQRFEDLHIVNKYDAIVMNPPYGTGGKTAIEHLAKAVTHLRNGGRIVALIPDGGAATKRFEAFYEGDDSKDVYMVADISLPTVTFKRAGTAVKTRVVVLEKQTDKEIAAKLQHASRDYADVKTVKELFDRIEESSIPERLEPLTKEAAPLLEGRGAVLPEQGAGVPGAGFEAAETVHSQTGEDLFVAKVTNRVDREAFSDLRRIAKRHKGYYSRYAQRGAIPGFQFKSAEQRDNFIAEATPSEEEPRFARRGDQPQRPILWTATETYAGGRVKVNYQYTEKFAQEREAVADQVRDELDQVGLQDVKVRVSDAISASFRGEPPVMMEGAYTRGLIDIALDGPTIETARHEAIHAMRNFGLFTDQEWNVLSAKSDKTWREQYNIDTVYKAASEETKTEEGIAHAYTDWVAGKTEATGAILRAFEKIKALLRALGNALRGQGFQTVDDVFERVVAGEVGARPRAPRRARAAARVEPKFALDPNTRDTAAARSKAAQGWLAKGQPIDRAMRLPFEWIGGVNDKGEWQPGRKMFDKAAKTIVGAKFSPDGPFRWMNAPMEAARAGLIDRYGLSPEYVVAERQRDLEERRIAMQGAEILKTLAEQKVGAPEARVLQAILTGEKVSDADMEKLAVPIRQAIDELGQEAVSLGLLSAESYERNRGAYLHRVYMKHEADQPALSRWFNKMMTSRRKKIIGDAFKGRGIFLEIDRKRLLRDVASYQEGLRRPPIKGDKFYVLDKVIDADTLSGIPDAPEKIERRVYWPSDEAIPGRLADYRNRGVWEVRGDKGNRFVLWRDYTKAEREKMGEIQDARYTIGKTFMLMSHDLATGRFYKDISENEEWSAKIEPRGKWVEASDYRRLWADQSVEWVKVPTTALPQSGGKKRWGALAGRWVRSEIWRDLNEIEVLGQPHLWGKLLTQWKLNKTARSPVVHMNNIMSNFMFMDLADVRLQDLVGGVRAYATGNADFEDAAAHGAFGADLISQEIRRNVLQPVLEEIEKDMKAGGGPDSKLRVLGKIAEAIWSKAKAADRKMVEMYRLEDEVFRMAMYMRRKSLGESAQDAALEARQQFLDYDIRAPWVNMARRTVLPFLAYTYRAVPLIAQSVSTRPWKLAKYFTLAYAANFLAYMIAPGDEDEERRSIRDEARGYTWIGVPRMMRMPYRDSFGNPVFLDIRRWIPAGDVFDIGQGHSVFSMPAPLGFGGPLMLGMELSFNKSAFTGDEIISELTDTPADRATKTAEYLWKAWMPSAAWIPGSWYWNKIGLSLRGATDSRGRPYPLPETVASSFGIKLKPQDVQENFQWRRFELQKARRALRAEERRLGRLRERNVVSEETYKDAIDGIDKKRDMIDEREKQIFK